MEDYDIGVKELETAFEEWFYSRSSKHRHKGKTASDAADYSGVPEELIDTMWNVYDDLAEEELSKEQESKINEASDMRMGVLAASEYAGVHAAKAHGFFERNSHPHSLEMNLNFTDKHKPTVLEGYHDGEDPSEMAEELGVSERKIRRELKYYLSNQNASPVEIYEAGPNFKGLNDDTLEKLDEAYENGMDPGQAAWIADIELDDVYVRGYWAREHDYMHDEVEELAEKGFTKPEIVEKTDISEGAVDFIYDKRDISPIETTSDRHGGLQDWKKEEMEKAHEAEVPVDVVAEELEVEESTVRNYWKNQDLEVIEQDMSEFAVPLTYWFLDENGGSDVESVLNFLNEGYDMKLTELEMSNILEEGEVETKLFEKDEEGYKARRIDEGFDIKKIAEDFDPEEVLEDLEE